MSNRIFSGMRPSGKLHLGNYLGALKQWVKLQDDAELAVFAAVDYHGITTPFDPETYHQQVMDVILDYLAAGVNPDKAILMRQSKVPQHTELAWIFNTITPVSWLERLPNYREKVEQVREFESSSGILMTDERSGKEAAEAAKDPMKIAKNNYESLLKRYTNNTALLDYPVLMASDILIYKPNLVPVGEDQLPHIDLANEIAKKFNSMFGGIFPIVKPFLAPAKRIMSLQDPTKKMSKTGDDGIALTDSSDEIRSKIKKATTDSGKEVKFDETKKPAISNLLTIFSEVTDKLIPDLEKEYIGKSYVDFKNDLAEAIIAFLKPFQERREKFASDMASVEKILESGEQKARTLADSTLSEVKQKMGL